MACVFAKGKKGIEMEEQNRTFDIRFFDLWTVLKRCWWLMLAVLVVVGSSTYLIMKQTHDPKYTSTATIYVTGGAAETDKVTTSNVSIATTLVKDFDVLIKSNNILQGVYNRTGAMLTTDQLKSMVSITNPTGTRVLQISVTAGDPVSAEMLANAFADVTCEHFNALFTVKNENGTVEEQTMVRVFDPAVTPKRESNPVSKLMVLLIAAGCAMVVYLVYFVLFLLDDKINDADDVQKYLKLNILGEIPNRADVGKKKGKYSYYAAYTSDGSGASASTGASGK